MEPGAALTCLEGCRFGHEFAAYSYLDAVFHGPFASRLRVEASQKGHLTCNWSA